MISVYLQSRDGHLVPYKIHKGQVEVRLQLKSSSRALHEWLLCPECNEEFLNFAPHRIFFRTYRPNGRFIGPSLDDQRPVFEEEYDSPAITS